MKKALLRVARAATRRTAVMVWFKEKWNLTWAKRTRKRSSVSERSLVCCNARGEGTTDFNIQNPAWVRQGNACKPLVSTGKQTPNNGNLATRPLQHTKNKDPKRTQHSAHTFHTSTKENPKEPFFPGKTYLKQLTLTRIPNTAWQNGAEWVGVLCAQQTLWL